MQWKLIIHVEDTGANSGRREVSCGLGSEEWWLEGNTAEEAAQYFLDHVGEEHTANSSNHYKGNGGWINPPKEFSVKPVKVPESGRFKVIPPNDNYILEKSND